MTPETEPKIAFLICQIVGVGFLLLIVFGLIREARLRYSGLEATGEVVRHEKTDSGYQAVVQFSYEGQRHEARSRRYHQSPEPPVGSRSEVAFLPGDPATSKLTVDLGDYVGYVVGSVIALLILAIPTLVRRMLME